MVKICLEVTTNASLLCIREKRKKTDFFEHIKRCISKLKVDTENYESIEFEVTNEKWYHRNHVIGNKTPP